MFDIQQHALRLMAFGQIYKVLEMEPLPSNKPSQKYPWSDKEGACTCLSLFPVFRPLYPPHVLSFCPHLAVFSGSLSMCPFFTLSLLICLCEGLSVGLSAFLGSVIWVTHDVTFVFFYTPALTAPSILLTCETSQKYA